MFKTATTNTSNASSSNSSIFQQENGSSAFIQPKLNIGTPGDKYEVEADRMADAVVAKENDQSSSFFTPAPIVQKQKEEEVQKQEITENEVQQKPLIDQITPLVQRQSEEETVQQKEEQEEIQQQTVAEDQIQHKAENNLMAPDLQKQEEEIQEKEEEEDQLATIQTIQRKSNDIPNANSSIESKLNNSKGGGSPMSKDTQTQMESGFGTDFSNVRVHTDSNAKQMSQDLGAQAFTHGNDIYFNEGKYDTTSDSGNHLLAHELTHTVQQGASVQPKMLQKTGDSTTTPSVPVVSGVSEVTSLQSPTFIPLEGVGAEIEEGGRNGADINVSFGEWASGIIRIKKNRDDTYSTKDSRQSIGLNISYLSPLRQINITPVLAVQIENNSISGYITTKVGDRLIRNSKGLINTIKEHSTEMGWVGIDVSRVPDVENSIEGGTLTLSANGIPVELGGFVNGTLDFGIEGSIITFRANGTVNVPNLDPTQISIERDAEGNISGEVDLAVNIANFNGSIHAAFLNGIFDIRGTVGYETEKMKGQVTLLVTDAATARNVALSQLDPSLIDESAREANGIPEANSGPTEGPRAMAGWGEIDFRFTEWMTGKAKVIIDNEGHVTIQGEVTPPAEVELFAQRDYIKELFTLEARTLYGVPLVGNVFLFANIGLEALAKIGPAKIYNIRATGTYSTDPAIFNEFSLEASFNMSMFAGLRLRAEGGLGVELLGHDIKAGVGVNALAGVRGYVDATPRIEYRETSSPEAGRQGEFYFNGHAEIAAQPFLGLGGDLFVELDSPWWSPAPDKKWTWPLGELEYPLPGEFGIGADIDYVIGSGEWPDVEFGEVDFNKDKFMTDLMNDHVPPKQSNDSEQEGEFTEGGTGEGGDTPQLTDSEGNPNPGEAAQGQQDGLSQPPSPEVMERWGDGMQALQLLATASESDPLNRSLITVELNQLRSRFQFTRLEAIARGDEWRISATMPNIDNTDNPMRIKGDIQPGDEQANTSQGEEDLPSSIEETTTGNINEALTEIDTEGEREKDEGQVTAEEAEGIKNKVNTDHASVINISSVTDGEDTWDYNYVQRAVKKIPKKTIVPTVITPEPDSDRPKRVVANPLTSLESSYGPGQNTGSRTIVSGQNLIDSWIAQTGDSHPQSPVLGIHILAHHLHGPWNSWNIVFGAKSINEQMKTPERLASNNKDSTLEYDMTVGYHEDSRNDALITGSANPSADNVKKALGYYLAKSIKGPINKINDDGSKTEIGRANAELSTFPDIVGEPVKSVDELILELFGANLGSKTVNENGKVYKETTYTNYTTIAGDISKDVTAVRLKLQALITAEKVIRIGNTYYVE